MDLTSSRLTLSDGRTLGYAIYGSTSPTAHSVFYFHGTPSSRLEAAILSSPSASLNIRVIAVDRPGMGLSTFQARRKILDWPRDITELANHLNLPTFSIIAYSGGSPYAFACAKLIPRARLLSIGIMAGVFPLTWDGLVLVRPLQHLMTSGLSHLVGSSMNSQWGDLARSPDPSPYYEACMKEMPRRPEVEQKALGGVEKVVLFDPMREAFRVDGKGIGLETKLQAADWGFSLDEIDCTGGRVKLWHGASDVNVPVGQARKAMDKLPGAELNVIEGEGHIGVVVHHGGEALKHLAL
ncbi:Alpha/Beta hydrolase protein [Rhexocercosporidium sp. MPI-PUGE-AT-0058]|nr:Alpha/Beta hydrolase protein [Rhexocercosporidium sp. MPI-PUGE-AT-0058]